MSRSTTYANTLWCIVPALLAGGVGVWTAAAGGPEEYVERLRVLLLGSSALGGLGVCLFVWRRAGPGPRRLLYLPAVPLALRLAYLPILAVGIVGTAWLVRLGEALGAAPAPGLLHYGLGCFVALGASLAGLVLVAALSNLKRVGAWFTLLAYAGLGVLAFAQADDRTLSPHPFAQRDLVILPEGPDYAEVAEQGGRGAATRVLAAGSALRDLLMPRTGWGGMVRDELSRRFRGRPGLTCGDRVTALEGALLTAWESRNAPRTPPP